MKFGLLGPVAVREEDGRLCTLEPRLAPQNLSLLARLLLAGGQRVGNGELVDWLWGRKPPLDAEDQLHNRVSRVRVALRGRLGPGAADPVPVDSRGYRLLLVADQVDVHRFRRLADEARALGSLRHVEAVRLYRAALAEWESAPSSLRGGPEPLAGIPGQQADHYRETLRSEHRDVLVECLRLELDHCLDSRLVAELTALSRADEAGRDDQELTRLLMLAHDRSGHPEEALRVYRASREWLIERKGVEPGAALRDLNAKVLRQDHDPGGPNGASMTPTSSTESPVSEEHAGADTPATQPVAQPSAPSAEQTETAPGREETGPSDPPPPPAAVHMTFKDKVDARYSVFGFGYRPDVR